jgi:hypothetical protein
MRRLGIYRRSTGNPLTNSLASIERAVVLTVPCTCQISRPHVVMPRARRISSLLKRWLLGTHQGAVRPHQLGYYLDEFSFRF